MRACVCVCVRMHMCVCVLSLYITLSGHQNAPSLYTAEGVTVQVRFLATIHHAGSYIPTPEIGTG